MAEQKDELLRDLEKSIQAMVLDSEYSAEDACLLIFGRNPDTGKANKAHFTLYKEINPEDHTAKLGYMTLLQLMDFYSDSKPLEKMAAYLGKAVVDIPDANAPGLTEDNAYSLAADAQIALADVLIKIREGLDDDGRLSRSELMAIFGAVHDAHAKLAVLGSAAKVSLEVRQ